MEKSGLMNFLFSQSLEEIKPEFKPDHQKVSPSDGQGSRILASIVLEQFNAIRVLQCSSVSRCSQQSHQSNYFIEFRSTGIDKCFVKQKCPLTWQSKWERPEDPLQNLRGLVTRALAIRNRVDKAENRTLLFETLDLSELLHLGTFLDALRQDTARAVGHSGYSLMERSTSRSKATSKGQCFVPGRVFDGNRLSENQCDSPSVSSVPPCFWAGLHRVCMAPVALKRAPLPVHASAERDLVTGIDVPCGGSQDQWIQCGKNNKI